MELINHIQFFTATILEWKILLEQEKYKNILIDSLRYLVDNNRIKVYGFVIMPNHVHILWKINDGLRRQDVQRDFLKYTAQQIRFELNKSEPEKLRLFEVNAKDRKYQIWERNALSIEIYSRKVLEQKLTYIHNNPLQGNWSLCECPEDYKYSSATYYMVNKDDWGFITHYYDDI
jgi:REP element-mobilizing transposase RayT